MSSGFARPPRRLRILLVEDEMLVAMLLEGMLTELGHESVATAANLAEAMEMVAQGGFDCAILDVNVNGEGIYPVADALARRGIPFSFATGYAQRSLPDRHQERPTLRKPVELGDLEIALGRMIDTLRVDP